MRLNNKHTFISYTTRDGYITSDVLGRVKTYFEKTGSTFIDILDNDSQLKQERVYNELEKADLFVLLNTPAIRDSKWVIKEIEIAKNRCMNIISLGIDEIEEITATNNVYTK